MRWRPGSLTQPVAVVVGDWNGDGADDLAVAKVAGGNIAILLNNGSGVFGAATNFTVNANPFGIPPSAGTSRACERSPAPRRCRDSA